MGRGEVGMFVEMGLVLSWFTVWMERTSTHLVVDVYIFTCFHLSGSSYIGVLFSHSEIVLSSLWRPL